jgi:beta-lactamase regulating signal transducer with metallopeptidase domain
MIALLVESALRSLVLGGLVGLAMLVFRARNPHLQKTVWLVVLLACLAMPFVLEWRMAPSFSAPTYLLTLPGFGNGGLAPNNAAAGTWLAPVLAAVPMRTLTFVYGVIALVLLIRFAVGLLGVWRIRRKATPLVNWATASHPATDVGVDSDIRISAEVQSPATFGSTILLPASAADWSEDKLLAVLTHERSHVGHRDSYVLWLSCLHTCVIWFNPLAWWLHRRLADLAETTSDDAVLRALPDRATYASLLLDIAQQRGGPSVVMSAARSNIEARIERIISNTPPARPPQRRAHALASIALMPLLAVAAATLQPMTPDRTPPTGIRGPTEPKLLSYGGLQELQQFYPKAAKRAGVETVVDVSLTFDATGVVTEAQALDPKPSDVEWGFPDAAVAVAKTVKFRNESGQPERTRLRVRFALDQ